MKGRERVIGLALAVGIIALTGFIFYLTHNANNKKKDDDNHKHENDKVSSQNMNNDSSPPIIPNEGIISVDMNTKEIQSQKTNAHDETISDLPAKKLKPHKKLDNAGKYSGSEDYEHEIEINSSDEDNEVLESSLERSFKRDDAKLADIPSGISLDLNELKTKEQELTEKRSLVLNEIVQTEESYLLKLNVLCTQYLEPLLAMQDPDAAIVVGNIVAIKGFHEILLGKMKQRDAADADSMAEVFSKHGEFLKMYATYIEGYERKSQLVQQMKKRPSSKLIFETARENHVEQIESLMVALVQRIPRYLLLLREVLKCSQNDTPTHAKLVEVYNKMEAICSFVNLSKKHADGAARMVEIQNGIMDKFDGLIIPGRTLIKEAEVTMKGSLGKMSRIRLFLFNDLIIWTSPNSLKLRGLRRLEEDLTFEKKAISMKQYYGLKIRAEATIFTDSKSSKSFSESLNSTKSSNKERRGQSHVFFFKEANERDSWIELLTKTQNDLLEWRRRSTVKMFPSQ